MRSQLHKNRRRSLHSDLNLVRFQAVLRGGQPLYDVPNIRGEIETAMQDWNVQLSMDGAEFDDGSLSSRQLPEFDWLDTFLWI